MVLTIAAIFLIVGGLKIAGSLFIPLLTAAFITLISAPAARLAHDRLKVPRPIAIALTVLIDLAVLTALGALLVSAIDAVTDVLPRYQRLTVERVSSIELWAHDHGYLDAETSVTDLASTAWLAGMLADVLRELTNAISNIVLVVLLVLFLLFELEPGKRKMAILLEGPLTPISPIATAAARVQRYLVVKTYLSIVIGTLSGLWLAILGVDFALLIGLATFLLNYIPSVGAAIALLPAVLVALLASGPAQAVAVGIGLLVINMVIGNLVEPRVMGQALELSTFVVFASMLFWGWIWGPLGALYAVPLTMLLRSLLEAEPSTRWLALLLGSSAFAEAKRKEWGWPDPDEVEGP